MSRLLRNYWWIPLATALIVLPWFFQPGYIFLTDLVWGPQSLGGFLPATILPIIQKLYLSGVLALTFFAGSFLGRVLGLSRILAVLVGLYAVFNPFVYDRFMYGQITVVLSYALIVTCFAFLVRALIHGPHQLVYSGLAGGLAVAVLPHAIFFVGLLVIISYILHLVHTPSAERWRMSLYFALMIVLVGLLSLFQIARIAGDGEVKSFVSSGISSADLQVFKTAGQGRLGPVGNVLLLSGFWGKDQYRYFDLTRFSGNWGRSFFLLPLLLYGLYRGYKSGGIARSLVVLVSFAMLAALVLGLGVSTRPTGYITGLLFETLPFYRGLREPQKWVALISLAYMCFLSFGLRSFFSLDFVRAHKRSVTVFLAGVILMQAPLLLWGGYGQITAHEYPAEWAVVNERLVRDGCAGTTLILPWHLYMSFGFTGKVIAHPGKKYFDCPVITGTNMEFGGVYDNSNSNLGQAVEEWLQKRGETSLLTNYDIRYMVLLHEVDWTTYLWTRQRADLEPLLEAAGLELYAVTSSSSPRHP